MKFRALKYGMIFAAIGLGFVSLLIGGAWTFALPIYAFGLVPLSELLFKPNPTNLSKAELEMVKHDRIYDYLLYLVIPVQFSMIFFFGYLVSLGELTLVETIGGTWTVGVGCSVLGINVAHELGHRNKKYEQWMSKALLLTSLYMHFFIEHNRGHHANVSTPEDPASSRRGQTLYAFWFRSVALSYLSAWKLENGRLQRKGVSLISFQNEMLMYHFVQAAFVGLIFALFGLQATLLFVVAAVSGFLLLETVNYIEHYGLQREKEDHGRYERVKAHHSWNSDHPVGRLLLFELSRHSDHHYRAGRKYQVLRHIDNTPQMPTGYPGMMILSLVPPLWFAVMNPLVDKYQGTISTGQVAVA